MSSDDQSSESVQIIERIKETTKMMITFIDEYDKEVEDAAGFALPNRHFPDLPRPDAFEYAQTLIDTLQEANGPRLHKMNSLPKVDQLELEHIFQNVGKEDLATGEAREAYDVWNGLQHEYNVMKEGVKQWRVQWYKDLIRVVRAYNISYRGLVEEEQRFFLTAFKEADPKNVPVTMIAMMGPMDSPIYALARAANGS